LFLATSHPHIPLEAYLLSTKGEIITGVEPMSGHSSKIGWGMGVFDVDIERFWAALNNGDQHAGYTPVNYTELVEGKPCTDKRKIFMTLPIPILPDRWWVTQTNINPALQKSSQGRVREMSWQNIKSPQKLLSDALKERTMDKIQIPFSQGAWVLIDLGEGYTLGEYHTWAKAGGNVPNGLTSIFVQKSIIKTMNAMEEYSRRPNLPCLQK
jgi:hypothetical protein